MDHSCKFSIIQFAAHPARNERLNVGIVVFLPDRVDVHVSRRLERVKALSAGLDVNSLRESILNVAELDGAVRRQGIVSVDDRVEALSSLASFEFSSCGSFEAPSSADYESAISNLLLRLVEPEPAPLMFGKPRSTGLLKALKSAFRNERVLAKKGEEIGSHRIVANYPIAGDVRADLVLRNGAMHVIQTVDVLSDALSIDRVFADFGRAALKLDLARMTFGASQTKTKLVYQASSALEKITRLALDSAHHQGADLVNWESHQDRQNFVENIATLAERLPTKAKAQPVSVHASTQHRFTLN